MKTLYLTLQQVQKHFKFLQVFLSLIIFFALVWFVFKNYGSFKQVLSFHAIQWKFFVMAFLLLLPNLGIEAFKWFILNQKFYKPLTFGQSFLAVIVGNATAFITPQKLGDYVGRALFLPAEQRPHGIALTFISRLHQLGATILFGLLAALGLNLSLQINLLIFLSLTSFYLGVYFFPKLISILKALVSVQWKFSFPEISPKAHLIMILLSNFRFIVFLSQYVFCLQVFGLEYEQLWIYCSLIFLCKSLIPSIAFSELGVREGIAMWIFQTFTPLELAPVFMGTFLLFVLNTLFPTLVGSLILNFVKLQQTN